MRLISPTEAKKAYDILIRAAGASAAPESANEFIHHVAHPYDPAGEYRFCGLLGLGGKFRNEVQTPHVTCYPEDMNEGARSIISTTNALLAALFSSIDEAQTPEQKESLEV